MDASVDGRAARVPLPIAAIYDIHGNLPALEAVLEEIRAARVGAVVVGGDVLPGPMPRETLACLATLKLPVYYLRGNGEVAVLQQMAGQEPAAVPPRHRPPIAWTAEQLGSEHQQALSAWPRTLSAEAAGWGRVLFCHATPRDENEIFTRLTPESRLEPIFAGLDRALVVCGHTHMQFDRRIGTVRVVNAGSVGMPFGEPGADWLLLGSEIQLRHTRYDLAAAAGRIRATSYPQAQEFALHSVLQPPSEASMLEAFAHAEAR